MTTAVQIGETARDRADFCRCFKTGAAVFLHDDGIVAHGVVLAPLLVSSLRRVFASQPGSPATRYHLAARAPRCKARPSLEKSIAPDVTGIWKLYEPKL